MRTISAKAPKENRTISPQEKQEDYYKGFRSSVVLLWILSNLALAGVILSTGLDQLNVSDPNQNEQQRSIVYMKVVLFSVAALSLFRFIGACWFLIVRLVSCTFLYTPTFLRSANCDYSSVVYDPPLCYEIPDTVCVLELWMNGALVRNKRKSIPCMNACCIGTAYFPLLVHVLWSMSVLTWSWKCRLVTSEFLSDLISSLLRC